ncbi:NUDIX hydrolase [Leptolyngbya sp. FACHB-17]|uniref:NUDIX hydrolase n=1 Tax=unclassified Leptolyngbya TaxID=2650499 RepID=UPI0016815CD3|nr:NUDIX hydrolase [Leptolyngbya sp. FACHB-17]MBD2081183.1 NUDIX hydrolase [Leptolyngbya sp. FACHB-17]
MKPEVAIAILYQQDQFLLQLRDNVPNIAYPGHWGLFGGHIEADESPEVALVRELQEEIRYSPPNAVKFGVYEDDRAIRHVFAAPLTVGINELTLLEGWDLGLFTRSQVEQGERFSDRANQIRPLGAIHQRILLDFIKKNG